MNDTPERMLDQKRLVADLKAKSRELARRRAIPVAGLPGVMLVPVGPWILDDEELIRAMAHWRALAREMFFAQFPESAEGMRDYLARVSIGRDDAILFVIEEQGGAVLGHLGLKHIFRASAEVDSVMRNPTLRIVPGIMAGALRALTSWARNCLNIPDLSLKVISYNAAAISLYKRSGFVVSEERALRRRVDVDRTEHDEVGTGSGNVEYRCLVMTIERVCRDT